MLKLVTLLAASILVMSMQGCTVVPKQLTATGGSRADGIVKLSYEYGMFETVQIDGQQAINEARQRCAGWGYRGAEPFGGSKQKCISHYAGDCKRWLVTIDYQCTH